MDPATATGQLTAPHTAPPPFDKHSADIVLRTSDGVNFHVWKCLLEDVSEFFAGLFKLDPADSDASTQPSIFAADRVGEKPVVPVSETSAVIEPLLRTFHPPPNVIFSSLDDLKPVIAAADKYVMEGVLQALKERLLSFFVHNEPLRVYALGVQYSDSMQGVTEAAILAFLTVSEEDAHKHVVELNEMTASAYRELLIARQKYLVLLKKALRGLSWLSDGGWIFLLCTSCARGGSAYSLQGGHSQRVATLWFTGHYQRIGEILEAWPSRKALEDSSICEQAFKEGSRCVVCRESVHEHMRLFMTSLRQEVDRLVAQVAAEVIPAQT